LIIDLDDGKIGLSTLGLYHVLFL